MRDIFVLILTVFLFNSCVSNSWKQKDVTEKQVSYALGFSKKNLYTKCSVKIPPIKRIRPCCAFGMDIKVGLSYLHIPFYRLGNVKEVSDLGGHQYDNGAISIDKKGQVLFSVENNGLIYTCKGGFIDTAHLRDYADMTLFLTNKILEKFPKETVFKMKRDGTEKTIKIKTIPDRIIKKNGLYNSAVIVAQWIAFYFSVWHEIVTWYDYESIKGFSEKASSFSPEDLYSNVLGINIAGGILIHNEIIDRDQWNREVDSWIKISLDKLGAVSRKEGRKVMGYLDGKWWDSKKVLPDWKLTKYRNFSISTFVIPDLPCSSLTDCRDLEENLGLGCAEAIPHPLSVKDSLDGKKISSFVELEFVPGKWTPKRFPFKDKENRKVTVRDFQYIIEKIKEDIEKSM